MRPPVIKNADIKRPKPAYKFFVAEDRDKEKNAEQY
jgi:hypothetical protein